MAASFFFVRSCVSSTEVERLSTLPFTSPTRLRTNPLVAHAGRPTATIPASVIVDIHFDMTLLLKLKPAARTRSRHVPASCPNHEVVPFMHAHQQRMPARGRRRLERDHVLMAQLSHDLFHRRRRFNRRGAHKRRAARPPRE